MAKIMAAKETDITYTKTVARRSHFLLFFCNFILFVSFDLLATERLTVFASLGPVIENNPFEAL